MRNQIIFFLNGEKHVLSPEDPQGALAAGQMLADYLRQGKGLTGTKIVCAEGDCGACTVLRYAERPQKAGGKKSKTQLLPINSCITRVAQMDGSSLVTVEGVTPPHELSPVQQAMVSCHGSQCGFCTPGFVMALTGLVEKKIQNPQEKKGAGINEKLESQEIKNSLTGNLCRCTGYQPIVEAAVSIPLNQCRSLNSQMIGRLQVAELRKVVKTALEFNTPGFSFFAPTSVSAAANYLKKNPRAKIVSGGTDLGVLQNKRKLILTQLMSLHLIGELYELKEIKSTLRARVGANVTLSELREFCKTLVPEFSKFLDLFASPQIKNVATLAGNVGNASPIAETPPFLLVARTLVNVAGVRGRRQIPIEKFFISYRKTALKPGEFIVSFEFDLPQAQEKLALYKVSQRKDLDISTVNAAFRAEVSEQKIKSLQIAMGGVAATPLRLKKTEALMIGKVLSPELLKQAARKLHAEMTPMSDLRGSMSFRRVVVENLFFKFFRSFSQSKNSRSLK